VHPKKKSWLRLCLSTNVTTYLHNGAESPPFVEEIAPCSILLY